MQELKLVINKEGELLIPRLEALQPANERYNSSRRQIRKELKLQDSSVLIQPFGDTIRLQEASNIVTTARPHTTAPGKSVVQTTHSLLSSIRVVDDFFYIIIGKEVDTKRPVVVMSKHHASMIEAILPSYTRYDVPSGNRAQFLMLLACNLLASSILQNLSTGAMILVHEPDPMLAIILTRRARERNFRLLITTTRDITEARYASLIIHPLASRTSVKSMLPSDIVLFADLSNKNGPNGVGSHIASCLKPNCRRVEISNLNGNVPSAALTDSETISLRFNEAFTDSLQDLAEISVTDVTVLGLNDIIDQQNIDRTPFDTIDWTKSARAVVPVMPVDSQPLFAQDKTFWLVGLTGDLGLSLCEWMLRHGAKHIVLTSRKPKISEVWLQDMKAFGGDVTILPWLICPCIT